MKVIITGATGMVGEGVTLVCLNRPEIEKILVIGRRPCGIIHPKVEELVVADMSDISSCEERVKGYDACFFCLGISSVGAERDEYYATTYTLTLGFAGTMAKADPGMTFCYVAGAGTDETEKSMMWWAQVKGKTENDLAKLPLVVYGMRPGFIKPYPGQIRTLPMYKCVGWTFPVGRKLSPSGFCTMEELALSMIYLVRNGSEKKVINGRDIISFAAKAT